VRELERPPDDARTTVEDTRTHRIGHLDDVFAVHSTDASIDRRRIEPARPTAIDRAVRTCRTSRSEDAATRRSTARGGNAHRTVTSRNAHGEPQKKNRPHWAAGR